MKKMIPAAAMLCFTMGFSMQAQSSHLMITDISIEGIALDSISGPTTPTFNLFTGDSLDILAGFYDHQGGTVATSWTMHFNPTSSSFGLNDISTFITPSGDSLAPSYVSFSQILSTAGTWTGFLEPIQSESCPSYSDPNGNEGGGGCGDPSVSLAFNLNVQNVPEPTSIAIITLGLSGLAFSRRQRGNLKTETNKAQLA
ncbi:PEP-CTERM sorting domain-containing protein [Crenothrix sp.]|uniref:PEP-CTERM sorting domain-containing protein n=1 Tax=Crenothrix sp. TaxID=3100433 RepID=UPI00374D927A